MCNNPFGATDAYAALRNFSQRSFLAVSTMGALSSTGTKALPPSSNAIGLRCYVAARIIGFCWCIR